MKSMTREACVEALDLNQTQRLAQPVDHAGRRRVMVEALRAPVLGELREVEVVSADRSATRAEDLRRTRVVGHGRHPRRTAQTFLGAADRDIDLALVDSDPA